MKQEDIFAPGGGNATTATAQAEACFQKQCDVMGKSEHLWHVAQIGSMLQHLQIYGLMAEWNQFEMELITGNYL